KRTIIFNYLHTLSKPGIEPENYVRRCEQQPKEIEVKSEKVLRFGMMEGEAKVNARMATYDPQSPGAARMFADNGSHADKLAVVANMAEASQLSGRANPVEAIKVIVRKGAVVSIVKCGADGCLVGTAKGVARVPAYRTSRVWPIGSGDVFSALFAHGWM